MAIDVFLNRHSPSLPCEFHHAELFCNKTKTPDKYYSPSSQQTISRNLQLPNRHELYKRQNSVLYKTAPLYCDSPRCLVHNTKRQPECWLKYPAFFCKMMTSSNGNISRITGPLCWGFNRHRWIPLTKASDAELNDFFDLRLNKWLSKQLKRRWFELPLCSV